MHRAEGEGRFIYKEQLCRDDRAAVKNRHPLQTEALPRALAAAAGHGAARHGTPSPSADRL